MNADLDHRLTRDAAELARCVLEDRFGFHVAARRDDVDDVGPHLAPGSVGGVGDIEPAPCAYASAWWVGPGVWLATGIRVLIAVGVLLPIIVVIVVMQKNPYA